MERISKVENNGNMLQHDSCERRKSCGVFGYFVCSSREQVADISKRVVNHANSIGLCVSDVFYDKVGDAPHVLMNLLDICRNMPNSVIVAESMSCLNFSQVCPQAIMHFASMHGIRIVFVERSENDSSFASISALRYMRYIGNYYGFGIIDERSSASRSAFEERRGSIGRLPLGYCIKDSKVLISPRDAEAVGEIFKLFAQGVGVRDIELRVKVLFPDVKCPTRNQIYFIIGNSRYIGSNAVGLALPPIIENRLWLEVRSQADKRGLAPKEHRFLLKNLFYKGFGRMKPTAYCRSIHSPAYVIEGGGKSVYIDAQQIEEAVLSCASKILESDMDDLVSLCKAAACEAYEHAERLEKTLKDLESQAALSQGNFGGQVSVKTIIKGLDSRRIEAKLMNIGAEYERYMLENLSKTDEQIDAFFAHMAGLQTLSSEEKEYFLNILVKDVTVSADEVCIRCCCSKIKRIHIRPRFKIAVSEYQTTSSI